ncbi:MAG: hypothetical protein PHH59_04660 [Methylovulum sp.]|uniref:hypothetical protein n=1 Tax=Methylovulum sp. TaxID=1916980 RepID=UPI00261CE3FA|nr:hypothetical protein [Methylovulum sp.]MDD2723302.1 hypothetical protein [Methylovulum sp.]MDD5123381.1 hypothetical protein [Methylovulum sp.]
MDLAEHIIVNRPLAECVCQRLCEEINKLGFAASDIRHFPRYDEARFELVKDPYTGVLNMSCYWFDTDKNQRLGRLQFNSDGSFYAEYDIVKPHPGKAKWFVEGVTAWGQADNIKAEAKLLPISQ